MTIADILAHLIPSVRVDLGVYLVEHDIDPERLTVDGIVRALQAIGTPSAREAVLAIQLRNTATPPPAAGLQNAPPTASPAFRNTGTGFR